MEMDTLLHDTITPQPRACMGVQSMDMVGEANKHIKHKDMPSQWTMKKLIKCRKLRTRRALLGSSLFISIVYL